MHLYVSYLSSAIYWISSNYGLSNCITIPAKLMAILPLIPLSEFWFILILYTIGDTIMFWNIEYSMYVFIIGHSLYVFTHISNPSILLIALPFVIYSTYFVSKIFPKKLVYILYIICLHLILIYSITDKNPVALMFILSDLFIGIDAFPWTTWPLYYIAVVLSHVKSIF